MAKMTRKEMEALAKEYGYTAEYVFRQGLHCLASGKEMNKASNKNPIKYQIDRIIHNLGDIQIAMNILREWWGITFCDISKDSWRDKLQIHAGIDEVAEALNKIPKETNEWRLEKEFKYNGATILQLAERNSTHYKKAFEANGHYSTTYDKAYGVKEQNDDCKNSNGD